MCSCNQRRHLATLTNSVWGPIIHRDSCGESPPKKSRLNNDHFPAPDEFQGTKDFDKERIDQGKKLCDEADVDYAEEKVIVKEECLDEVFASITKKAIVLSALQPRRTTAFVSNAITCFALSVGDTELATGAGCICVATAMIGMSRIMRRTNLRTSRQNR
mmetsp:Transcript_13765/g.17309  ORF Transcript_13765/g.17309 Transcript_13765/m.17309 type:complete len:160 (+) Transcript_13765:38-517(+)